ncbi:hypothetical protein NDU88_012448 [Pleurodeles waltl]|uniref:Uncharacterized protein n=1 Tax=Pleurodeles waltl TaxID=8319 RepID=A0AAV7R2U9_PLEWA|nr:hypothetical protein NDU88_012448 [Pleurodeles waltl]
MSQEPCAPGGYRVPRSVPMSHEPCAPAGYRVPRSAPMSQEPCALGGVRVTEPYSRLVVGSSCLDEARGDRAGLHLRQKTPAPLQSADGLAQVLLLLEKLRSFVNSDLT